MGDSSDRMSDNILIPRSAYATLLHSSLEAITGQRFIPVTSNQAAIESARYSQEGAYTRPLPSSRPGLQIEDAPEEAEERGSLTATPSPSVSPLHQHQQSDEFSDQEGPEPPLAHTAEPPTTAEPPVRAALPPPIMEKDHEDKPMHGSQSTSGAKPSAPKAPQPVAKEGYGKIPTVPKPGTFRYKPWKRDKADNQSEAVQTAPWRQSDKSPAEMQQQLQHRMQGATAPTTPPKKMTPPQEMSPPPGSFTAPYNPSGDSAPAPPPKGFPGIWPPPPSFPPPGPSSSLPPP